VPEDTYLSDMNEIKRVRHCCVGAKGRKL
jgi:hypothetical protein